MGYFPLVVVVLVVCIESICTHGGDGMTQADRDLMLKMHNDARRKVAKGKAVSFYGTPVPHASNMNELVGYRKAPFIAMEDRRQMTEDKCS